ncbi:hypothetical protein [uncultured Treponema sp.]|uniref:hypothetical protein n=1 Tax=uncultured Treponema sp. TaxID=162155 RepID=UPI002597381C|nr:hypothetical protein [uncultured Treponema sp.]
MKPGWNIDAGRGNMEAKSNPSYKNFRFALKFFFVLNPSVGLEAKLAPTKWEEEQTGSLRKQVKPGWNIDAGRGNMEAKSNPSYKKLQIRSEVFFCFETLVL